MNSNIQVNFEKSGGTNSLQYTFDSGCIEQNVTFTAQSTYDWLTITHTNNIVTFNAQAQAESAVDSRTAHYDIYVGTAKCLYTIDITQSGGIPCTCDAFRPISLGSIDPSGATVDTIVGSYTYIGIPQSCQANLITVVATSGDTPYPTFVAENGNIKLSSAIPAYEDGKTWTVEFRYNGTVCDTLNLSQTQFYCDCEHITEIIKFSHWVNPSDEADNLLIATADTSCGVFSATCNASSMLLTTIGGVEYPNRVKIVTDPITGTSAYVHLTQASQYRTCEITPIIKAKQTGQYVSCTDSTITLMQRTDYVHCSDIPNDACPETWSEYYCRGTEPIIAPTRGASVHTISYSRLKDSAYSANTDIEISPRVYYAGELTDNDYYLNYDTSEFEFCAVLNNYGTELPDPSVYAVGSICNPYGGNNRYTCLELSQFQGSNPVVLRIAYDIYAYGEFCKTSTCSCPNVLLIPQEACKSCVKRRWHVGEDCADNKTESYEEFNETFDPWWDDIASITNYFCSRSLIVTGVSASIVGTYTHDFSNYVQITDVVTDSDGNIRSYRLIVSENDTDEEFKYQVIYNIKNVNTNEDCEDLTARCRIKLKNVCNNCSEFMDKYCTITGDKNFGETCYISDECLTPRWLGEPFVTARATTGVCNDVYVAYMLVYDKDGNEITTTNTQFIGPNNNLVKTMDYYTYVQGRGWDSNGDGYFRYFIRGWYDGKPGWQSSGGHPADYSYNYKVRVYNTQTNEYCDSELYTINGKIGNSCNESQCITPTCSKNIPLNTKINLKSGVQTITRGDKERVVFPSTGATIVAYEFDGTFYYGSTTYNDYNWCQGCVLSVETSSQHVNVHPSFVDDGGRYTAISITVDQTSNTDGKDYAADIIFKLTTPNGTVSCDSLALTMYLYQKGTNEN